MFKILYDHPSRKFNQLNIAGDFTGWKITPMKKDPKNQDRWEIQINEADLPQGINKVHFKFIDDNGNWFTDEEYPKEVDEHDNENNVKMLIKEKEKESGNNSISNEGDTVIDEELDDEGPVSPAPSLNANNTTSTNYNDDDGNDTEIQKNVLEKESVQDDDDSNNSKNLEDSPDIDESTATPPASSDSNAVIKNEETDAYRGILATIIAFFARLFSAPFG
ncbi:hypothetical protein Kpol_1002p68 [Vanderwaltozyma polyspora DSM 70294]|uniref:Uncharacterized protein n=1 Tax=Vanderwaltozyma polyspora (strain ATCC 22028 / DSM 70294 / BCRC 21397 / CBS 2163 / NBRC 10782 / NRRL Y-8283 / UCD 57-17) TaxID=436907 RepID=A7TE99_VANPO|nr:uncharacterized protein Kpol_1002p68 [Vanderwaltozyma polyspora DSM 70294]EDO19421.1 hypothetical protein Kpol_1002p68 [Vanderwaltozyma polyspora DSM 70294]